MTKNNLAKKLMLKHGMEERAAKDIVENVELWIEDSVEAMIALNTIYFTKGTKWGSATMQWGYDDIVPTMILDLRDLENVKIA